MILVNFWGMPSVGKISVQMESCVKISKLNCFLSDPLLFLFPSVAFSELMCSLLSCPLIFRRSSLFSKISSDVIIQNLLKVSVSIRGNQECT